MGKRGPKPRDPYEIIDERLSSVAPDANGCVLWPGSVAGPMGYGVVGGGGGGRRHYVHRLVLERRLGCVIGLGQFACHECDVPRCCNADHLFLGDAVANVRDMFAKGRGRPGRVLGAENASAKLTDGDVLDIRLRYAVGGTSQPKLGREYGVSHAVIGGIVRGSGWAHVGGPRTSHGGNRVTPPV